MANPRTASCGTRSGFNRHRRDGTTPCDPCRQAEYAYQAEWWSRHPEKRKRIVERHRTKALVTAAQVGASPKVRVPLILLGQLLAFASDEVREWAIEDLGTPVIDAALIAAKEVAADA